MFSTRKNEHIEFKKKRMEGKKDSKRKYEGYFIVNYFK
jgi:hypothetical protein